MKKDIHPQYNPVVFVDITTGRHIVTSPFEVGRTAATAMTFGKGGGIIDVAEE